MMQMENPDYYQFDFFLLQNSIFIFNTIELEFLKLQIFWILSAKIQTFVIEFWINPDSWSFFQVDFLWRENLVNFWRFFWTEL